MPQSTHKTKLVALAAIGSALLGGVFFYFFFPSSSASPNLPDDPRISDSIFSNAVVIAAHLRDDPRCIPLGKLIIGYADPRRGPEAYREQILYKMTERIPRACFDEKATAAPPELVAYINNTNPALQQNKQSPLSVSDNNPPVANAPSVVQIEPLTVVLADPEKAHYFQTIFSVQVSDKESAEKTKRAMAELKDRALKLLSTKTSSDITTVLGKEALVKELVSLFNQPMSSIGGESINAQNIYFTTFVIQTE
ncbi:flagellar basal body-associated FliL family protein [Herbaspirillum huttiense F1]|uniref:flagellar basal body-associated FliL family protein n=1 Tax=Herbaspirillum TaxID=963 RepID=UPI00285E958B|nr:MULTISPECIES: flagellar basal body-associated FliL family protein [Herbaspirillum]MDR6742030.1 flagellar basal body-associated protein FliL [Herbaspirillum sp. 1173]MDT0358286.1 flagellar basal body-associated FliL family protein [Herbaspirillum huttiense F1]